MLKVYLVWVAASVPHLDHFQLAMVLDLRLLEMLYELLLVETGNLWIELDCLSVMFILTLEPLVDQLQPSLLFLVLLDWLVHNLELFQMLQFLGRFLT